jgi:hypothetical protein
MKHLFVSYTLAHALKMQLFNEDCIAKWVDWKDNELFELTPHTQNFSKGPHIESCTNEEYIESNKCTAPLYEQVVIWLDRQHGIGISVNRTTSGKFSREMWWNKGDAKGWDRHQGHYGFDSREEAYELSIKDAINKLMNYRMKEHVASGRAIDLSKNGRTKDGDYIITNFVDDSDYCDAEKEEWIWSIGRHKKTNQILASTSSKFYQNPDYDCLWLR